MKTPEYYDCNKTHGKRKMAITHQKTSANHHKNGIKSAVIATHRRACNVLLTGSPLLQRTFSALLFLACSTLRRSLWRRPTRQRLAIFSCSLLLSACGLNTPEPAPPPGRQAIEITRQQSLSLDRIDTLSVIVRGSPDDADREVLRLANQRGAQYYRIVSRTESEKLPPGVWRAFAVLYRQPAAQRP